MIDEKALNVNFVNVCRHGDGSFRFQDITPKRIYHYVLFGARNRNFLLVCEGKIDGEGLVNLFGYKKIMGNENIFKHSLGEEFHGFTHALYVPSAYHGYLKGRLNQVRDNLSWIIPIHNCEFSGNESKGDFITMTQKITQILNWRRQKSPKIRLYFNNPATGSGNNPEGNLVSIGYLFSEIKNLESTPNGFLEITNYKNDVIELLSPEDDIYVVIRERKFEAEMPKGEAIEQVLRFVMD